MDRPRGRGSAPVRDRLGPRADDVTGPRRTVGAEHHREGGAATDSGSGAATRAGAEARRIHGRRVCLQARRADQAGYHPRLQCDHAPRTPSTPARSPSMGARAATRSSMRARLACSSTCAVRSRAKSCGCTSRPTSTAAAAVLRLRHAYGSYGGLLAGQTWSTVVDENNMPGTIDFESPMAFPSIRQAQVRWTQKLGPSVSWSVAVEDNKSSITPPDDARQGRVSDAGPDHASPLRRLARPRAWRVLSRQGALPPDRGRAG